MRQLVFNGVLIRMMLVFTCGERKFCSTIKKAQSMINMIVDSTNQRYLCQMLPFFGEDFHTNTKYIDGFLTEILMIKESCNLKSFWPINCKVEFPYIWSPDRETDKLLFQFILLPTKSNDKIIWKVKKTLLWPLCKKCFYKTLKTSFKVSEKK